MKYLLFLTIVLLFSACEYTAPYQGKESINFNKDLSTWDTEKGITITETTTDQYELALVNLLSDESSTFSGGTTGDWVGSTDVTDVSSVPSTFTVIADPDDASNKLLYILLKREPLAEYIYQPVAISDDLSSYILRFDYKNMSAYALNIYVTYGTGNLDDSLSTYAISNGSSGTAMLELTFLTESTYNIRFGTAEIANFAPTFSLYLDNIALFETSNHSIYHDISLDEDGKYRVSVKARSLTSDQLTIKIDGEAKTFTLTSEFKEYGYYVTLNKSSVTMEFMPVAFTLTKRAPGSIELKDPALTFYPDKS